MKPAELSQIDVHPNPSLSPQQVVRSVLEALQFNRELGNDRGIEIAYRFASPASRAATGSAGKFGQIVKNPLYRGMLDHQTAMYDEPIVTDDQAEQIVMLVTSNYDVPVYVFTLSRQSAAPFAGCWMTDSVVLVEK